MPQAKYILSKSTYVKGVQCMKSLYLNKYGKQFRTPLSKERLASFEQGRLFEKKFKAQFRNTVDVDEKLGKNIEQYPAYTENKLNQYKEITLFEAGFIHEEVLVLTDVLQKNSDDSYTIYEVKNSTEYRDVHLWDLSVQYFVCKNRLANIREFNLVLKDENNDNFKIINLTEQLDNNRSLVAENISKFKTVLAQIQEPQIDIGYHCDNPYECEFKEYCRKKFSKSGIDGNISWNIANETLTIGGAGAMHDYLVSEYFDTECIEFPKAPWQEYLNHVSAVVIENGVTSIGNGAFWWSSSLKSITIPRSVVSIGNKAIEDCSGLTAIYVDGNNNEYCAENGVLFNKTKTVLMRYLSGKPDKSYAIPDTVTSIEKNAFSGCEALTSVIIPNSVTSIENSAFTSCHELTSINIPNSVVTIGDKAFFGCSDLTEIVNLATKPQAIADDTFENVVKAKCSLRVPDKALSAYCDAEGWKDFTNIKKILFPTQNGTAGDLSWRFSDGTLTLSGTGEMPNYMDMDGAIKTPWDEYFYSYNAVIIENGLMSIGDCAFHCCSSLTSIIMSDSVTSIGYESFRRCTGLASMIIPNSVKYIGDCAFSDCYSLTSITIPNSVISIGEGAFLACSNLSSITIPDSVKFIGESAFEDCRSLTSVIIPNSVTSIENCAFRGCDGLTSIVIPDTVTSIGDLAFSFCRSLKKIINLAKIPQVINNCFIGGYVFDEVDQSQCTLQVPAEALSAYRAAYGWNFFGKIEAIFELDFDNVEFQTALDLIENTNQSFFLTGKAGTGKSTFLKHIVETSSKKYVVVAPTGIAAINVGGVTIHSFFQFPLRPLLPEDEGIKTFRTHAEKRKIIRAMDTLIIDEISMARADLIDGIDCSLRRNGGNPDLPFGGKQVVFVGDVFQLEPVMIKNSGEKTIMADIYGSVYFYNAKVFEKLPLFTVELRKVYRQSDVDFISLLDKVRVKEITQNDINKINSRVFSPDELNKKDFAISLTATNEMAESVNSVKLDKLNTPEFTYIAKITGEFEESKYPTDPELTLKEGAQVIFVKNDPDKRWVNGTIGQVNELSEKMITVKLENGSVHPVGKGAWENNKYQYNKEKNKIEQEVVGTFEQYPLRLAWAITIHKSQGLTFDRVVIDFGNGTFASGQAYVALSRSKTIEGLFLKRKLYANDILVDEEIKDFAKSFNNREIIDDRIDIGKRLFPYQKNNDRDQIGQVYFEKAINNLNDGDFKSAFQALMTGFENTFRDSGLSQLIANNQTAIAQSFKTNPINCTAVELDFLRAVFYIFSDPANNRVARKGLPFIESFLEENPDSKIGEHLKSKIP